MAINFSAQDINLDLETVLKKYYPLVSLEKQKKKNTNLVLIKGIMNKACQVTDGKYITEITVYAHNMKRDFIFLQMRGFLQVLSRW